LSAPMKTRDRIIHASLELFNQQGERNVTTNHIAAHLGISPGNLYYHFRSKSDIIYELFLGLDSMVREFLVLPTDRQLTLKDKGEYLNAIFESMWEYRFFHRDLEHLLEIDERLNTTYRGFVRHSMNEGNKVYRGLCDAGFLSMTEAQIESHTINMWVISSSWIAFLSTSGLFGDEITRSSLRKGISQIIEVERQYWVVGVMDELDAWEEEFMSAPEE